MFSIKLGEDLTKYYEFLSYDSPIDAYCFFIELEALHIRRDYNRLETIIHEFTKVNTAIPDFHKKQLNWLLTIAQSYNSNNLDVSLEKLTQLLFNEKKCKKNDFQKLLDQFLEPVDLKIINSIAAIYYQAEQFDKGDPLLENCIERIIADDLVYDVKIILSIIYNLTKSYCMQNRLLDCIKYADLGIDIACKHDNTLLLLGDLYVQKGNAHESLDQKKEAMTAYLRFIYAYELANESDRVKSVKDYLEVEYNYFCP